MKSENSFIDLFSCITRSDESEENTAYLFKYKDVLSSSSKKKK